jgi:hypothetical protein
MQLLRRSIIRFVVFAFAIGGGCNKSKSEQPPAAEPVPKGALAGSTPVPTPTLAPTEPRAAPTEAPTAPAAALAAPAPTVLETFDLKANEGKTVELSGVLFESSGNYVLTSLLCETAPPRACGTTVPLVGVNATAANPLLTEHMGDPKTNTVRWSKAGVKIKGTLSGGKLTVSSMGPV